MVIFNVKYSELEEEIENLVDTDSTGLYCNEFQIVNDSIGEEACILAYGPAWRVTDKDVIVVEGVYCNYNKETDEYDPDWALTLVYKDVPDEEFDPDRFVYYEQDPPETAIHNYLQGPACWNC